VLRKEHENEYLRERIDLLTHQLYGKKSEKLQTSSGAEQLTLFSLNEENAEEEDEHTASVETVSVAAHEKKSPVASPCRPFFRAGKSSMTSLTKTKRADAVRQ